MHLDGSVGGYQPVGRLVLGGTWSATEDAEGWPEPEAKGLQVSGPPAFYRADSSVDGWQSGPFVVRAASVRGDAHRHYGLPRQDDMGLAWRPEEGFLLIAVADGVSEAPLSHVGAATVCRYALDYFQRYPMRADEIDWREVLEGCAWALVEANQRLEGLPEPEPARAANQLGTTLCLVTVSLAEAGLLIRALAVGDSGVGVIRDGRIVRLLGGKDPAVEGITETGVTPLPRIPDELDVAELILGPEETLLVATDGIWDPVGDGSGTVGRYLADALGAGLPSRVDYLRLVDFYRETHDDDRTLVAVRLHRPPVSDAATQADETGQTKEND